MTAGESHGKGLVAIVLGVPAGLSLTGEWIQRDLARRQVGYGRGGRMAIEKDEAEIIAGVRHGRTLGSPVALLIRNRDWENWKDVMAVEARSGLRGKGRGREVWVPRPGHADLAGALKLGHTDLRDVLERASARETAARVAVGSIARRFIGELGIRVMGWVTEIGDVRAKDDLRTAAAKSKAAERSELRCPDAEAEIGMKAAIDRARERGDTLGGLFEVVATGLPVGLGSYAHWDERLDGRIAGAIMSIPAIKGVEIGEGFASAGAPGSKVHDEIRYGGSGGAGARRRTGGFARKTNRAGGLEGGVTNGEDLVARAAMKPISTLLAPLKSVHFTTLRPAQASIERSDVCAVPAAAVVGEAAVAIELAKACKEKFGGDSMAEVVRNYRGYLRQIARA